MDTSVVVTTLAGDTVIGETPMGDDETVVAPEVADAALVAAVDAETDAPKEPDPPEVSVAALPHPPSKRAVVTAATLRSWVEVMCSSVEALIG
ncbi:MAG: hypothetical protein ACXVLX_19440 [Ilumatobacteraceae bacterium]